MAPGNAPAVDNRETPPSGLDTEQLHDVFRPLASVPNAPPDYTGLDHEDPEMFIRRCKNFFK